MFNITPDGVERIIAYYGRKLSSCELNSGVREKEFMGILHALRIWRPYLLDKPCICETDHKSLEGLLTQPNCTRRLARWLDEIAEYPIVLKWIAGSTNSVADTLSRHPGFEADNCNASVVDMRTFLKRLVDDPSCFAMVARDIHATMMTGYNCFAMGVDTISIEALCRQHYQSDPYLADILDRLQEGVVAEVEVGPESQKKQKKRTPVKNCPFELTENGLLWFNGSGRQRLCVPRNPELLQRIIFEHHDTLSSGHPGRDKTLYALQQSFFWRQMAASVSQYVRTCQSCQRNKTLQKKPVGLLNPLEIPEERWRSISMDFLTSLPADRHGFNAIWVIVCRLTKRILLIASKDTDDAVECAEKFFDSYLRIHDLPEDIVSDRVPYSLRNSGKCS